MSTPTYDGLIEDLGPLAPPQWLREHSAITAKGIWLTVPLKPFCVWGTDNRFAVPYAVKIVKPGTEEADIYDLLHRLDPASPNHTLPCDIIRGEHTFLVMPLLQEIMFGYDRSNWDLGRLLQFFHQVIEGLDFIHQLHIAHMDIYDGQVVVGGKGDVGYHKGIEAGKAYLIDFGSSRRLEEGPGQQHAIELPETNCKPPIQMSRFDPYAWDVYCTGIYFKKITERVYRTQPVPWILRRYAQWLIGEERGCTTVCDCRPSARRARQVLAFVQWLVNVWEKSTKPVHLVWNLLGPHVRPD